MTALLLSSILAATDYGTLHALLVIVAVVLIIYGIVTIFRGAVLYGILLIVAGLLIGPGGISLTGL